MNWPPRPNTCTFCGVAGEPEDPGDYLRHAPRERGRPKLRRSGDPLTAGMLVCSDAVACVRRQHRDVAARRGYRRDAA